MKRRLLICELHHLGDAVMALPFVNAAARDYEVMVCCRPAAIPVFQAALLPPKIVPLDPVWERQGEVPVSKGEADRQIREWGPEIGVCAWPDTRVHLLMRKWNVPERIGFSPIRQNYLGLNRPWRRGRRRQGRAVEVIMTLVGRRLLTRAIVREDYQQHHTRNFAQLAAALEMQMDFSPPWLAINSATREAEATTEVKWAIHPGGRLATKRWPWERMREVAKRHLGGGVRPVLVQPPDSDQDFGEESETFTLLRPQCFSELVTAFRAVDAVLCNDSLASHLAAALGKPTVTIFGSGNPNWFAPLGENHELVRSVICPLHPCIDRCEMPEIVCLQGVSVAAVGAAVERLNMRLTNARKSRGESSGRK